MFGAWEQFALHLYIGRIAVFITYALLLVSLSSRLPSSRQHIRGITLGISFSRNLFLPLLTAWLPAQWPGVQVLRAQGGLLRSDCSFDVSVGSNYPPGFAGVNPGRLVIRQAPILYRFGQAC